MSDEDLRLNPYVGLRPFFAEDSLYFYGREQQTSELLAILREHRFLAVVGSSGSGKSSLVRAGLLPALVGGFLVRDRDRWSTVQIKPGDAPMANLAAGLIAAANRPPGEAAALEHALRDDHVNAAVEFLRTHLDDRTNAFILVDQFEEIFAFRGADDDHQPGTLDATRRKDRARRRAEAAEFVDLLLRLSERRDLPIYVALTMRTDFLGECDLFFGLPEAFNRGRYLVPRLSREQLRDAVECPALLLGASIAPRLLDQVLNELGDRIDRLPVLQHALLRTWDAWDQGGRIGPIDLQHYWKAGGLEDALNRDAEAALSGLDRDATARVFKRLTDTDASQRSVRSPARISELVAASGLSDAEVKRIIDEFEHHGRSFVHASADGNAADPRVDISHESLIRQWHSLAAWVDEERSSRDAFRDLVARARRKAENKAALLQDPELRIVSDWRDKDHPASGWARRYSRAEDDFTSAIAYHDASVAARARILAERELARRWRWRWAPALILAVIALFVAGGSLQLRKRFESTVSDLLPSLRVPEELLRFPEGSTAKIRELTWTTNDGQRTVNWKDAADRCQHLPQLPSTVEGLVRPWRLPTTAELLDLYSPDNQSNGYGRKIRREFDAGVTSDRVWSTDHPDGATAARYVADFKQQRMVPLNSTIADAATVLCVTENDDPYKRTLGKVRASFEESTNRRAVFLGIGYFGAFLTLYYILATLGRWLQRRREFDPLVAGFIATSGRDPEEARASAAQQAEATVVHHTVYAPTLRRMAAWGIDCVLFASIASAMFFFTVSLDPRATVATPDGRLVEGKLHNDGAGNYELDTDDGEHLSFSESHPPEPGFIDEIGDARQKAVASQGTDDAAWSFVTRVVLIKDEFGRDYYGTFAETSADDTTMTLRFTREQWNMAANALRADLVWRYGSDTVKIEQEYTKWLLKNNPPLAPLTGVRKFPLRGFEITDVASQDGDLVILSGLMLVVAWLYDAVQIASSKQATVGMRIAGLIRTDLSGEPLSFGRASAWFAYRIGSFLTFGLGFLVQPFTKRKQALHDRLARSVVLRRPRVEGAVPSHWLRLGGTALVGVVLAIVLVVAPVVYSYSQIEEESGYEPDPFWSESWPDLGIDQTLVLLVNGTSMSTTHPWGRDTWNLAPVPAKPGEMMKVALQSTLTITPPLDCPDGGCPVGFEHGLRHVEDRSEVAALGDSRCDTPVAFASGDVRNQLFTLDLSFQAPDRPGHYELWVGFTKLACGRTPVQQPPSDRRALITFEVK